MQADSATADALLHHEIRNHGLVVHDNSLVAGQIGHMARESKVREHRARLRGVAVEHGAVLVSA